jgi:alpha-tubulin suppressor-like RCC1 family protein
MRIQRKLPAFATLALIACNAAPTATIGSEAETIGSEAATSSAPPTPPVTASASAMAPPVVGKPPADRLLACDHEVACVVRKNGGVACWGRNDFGQMGLGTISKTRVAPGKDVAGLRDVRSLAAGIQHACALTMSGDIYCWGANYAGQVGNGAPMPSRPGAADPKPVPSATRVVGLPRKAIAIDAGITHTCAVLEDGAVMCWGSNDSSELGVLSSRGESTPQLVPGVSHALEVACGTQHSCARLADNGVTCWGTMPPAGAGPICVTQLTAGSDFSCGVECNGGGARCWGKFPAQGNAGSPAPAPGDLRGLAEIRAGYWHVCMRDAQSQVRCWGGNDSGQLGVGKGKEWWDDWRDEPTAVRQSWKQTKELCAGGMSIRPDGSYRRAATFVEAGTTCALDESDDVYCWGAPRLDYEPRRVIAR